MFIMVYAAFAIALWQDQVSQLSVVATKTTKAHVSFTNETIQWKAEVRDLGQVFGTVLVTARFPNGTNATATDEEEDIGYKIRVDASKKTSTPWNRVLRRSGETATVKWDHSAPFGVEDDFLPSAQLASWYQNQESPPSRSRIHAYRIKVEFCVPPDESQATGECPYVDDAMRRALETGGNLVVEYEDIGPLEHDGAKIARACLLLGLVAIAMAWLPHAKREFALEDENDKSTIVCLALLLLSLAFFIDPIDCIVQFLPKTADIPPAVSFASFASRRLGEAMLLAVLLLAADGDGASAQAITIKWNEKHRQQQSQNQRQSTFSPHNYCPPVDVDGVENRRTTLLSRTVPSSSSSNHGSLHEQQFSLRWTWLKQRWWLLVPGLYLFFGIAALGLRFPSLFGAARAPTLALTNWPTSALREFVAFSLGIVFSALGWSILFCYLLAKAGRRLDKAPYLATRRHQLSYRFFVLQALLVAAVAVVSYGIVLVQLVRRYHRSIAIVTSFAKPAGRSRTNALEDLAGALEALVADDVRDLATAFFLEVYVGILLYLNLPPPSQNETSSKAFDHGGDHALAYVRRFLPQAASKAVRRARRQVAQMTDLGGRLVGARFVMTESADRKRRREFYKRRRRRHRNRDDYNDPLEDPPDFFVVHTARWLVRVAAEAYFDVGSLSASTQSQSDEESQPPEQQPRLTGSSAGIGDAGRLGLVPVCELYVEESDTYAVVATHARKPWLVIAFRGSASMKHWVTNINIRQYRLSLLEDEPDLQTNAGDIETERGDSVYFSDDEDDEDEVEEDENESEAESSMSEQEDFSASQRSRAAVDTILRFFALVYGSIERALGLVSGAAEAAGRASGAADFIPGVERLVLPCVHRGFWDAYGGVRCKLHQTVREVCLENDIERIFFTGHSMGGALATLAAADLAAHTIQHVGRVRGRLPRLTNISFGSPRVGNRVWSRVYDTLVPDTWRVVADGDVVSGLPRFFFKHCGTQVVVDGRKGCGSGFLIVDPSFIEKRLQLRISRKLSSHLLESYIRGLWGAAGIDNPSPAEREMFADDEDATEETSLVTRARSTLRRILAPRQSSDARASSPLLPREERSRA